MDAAVLKKVALFEGLTQGQLAKVARTAQARTYTAGDFLFRGPDMPPGTFVRTLSERLRETNDKIKAFFAISRF
ncbi:MULTISPECIES: hypothetical protein [unclassified Corallococcus]|uniref:hypothetical protein n=1 Tax=unclassified Corallococcus TaxID=2685029 RepID=UPI001A8E2403|nr:MULTISPECIES: hypothetical protein [unclassified Corallococcus]MBN9687317.1 hypothetical protein [Corallococcus sp. NCSPR001]WAS88859.1 hypothetical protein O0N60_18200 [Corallococcus sp. NCRR]